MADFLDSEAEESDQSEEEEVEPQERKKLKKLKAVQSDSSEEEEDNEEQLREEMKDLIDDNPIESDADSDASEGGHKKRKKSDDEDELDDRLEDDDYDLIEENLGVKVERKKFKRLRRVEDEDSDNEEADESLNREVIADQLFHRDGSDEEEDHRSERSSRQPALDLDNLDEEEGDEESDPDDFIVDDDGNPVAAKKKKKPRVFTDASLQEGQDIFGVDFDYDEFDKYEEESYDDESEADEYEEEDGEAGRERRQKKTAKKRIAKKSIFDIYEPSELKRGHFTDLDNEIRKTDMPERMQLRDVPISSVPEGSSELEDEAEWIYKQAFVKPSISSQTATQSNDLWGSGPAKKPSSTIGKIKQALDFMRNQQLEVPFIAFYRKEYVQPELTIADLWRVYKFDARWCQLEARKKQLVALFMNMQSYQTEKLMENPDASIPDEMRLVKDEDIDRVRAAQTQEELKDIHHHFILYCAWEIPAMREWSKLKERQKRRLARIDARAKALQIANDEGMEPPPEDPLSEDEVEAEDETLKLKMDSGSYSMCRKAGLAGMAKKFGLSPEHYAENLRSSYQRHEVEQEPLEPTELAKQFTTARFQTVEDVMYAAKFMVAKQISREPMLRKTIREIYFERAKISVAPTKQGIKEIDENHACYTMKYLKDKPVRELTRETFLKLHIAEEHKLLTVTLHEKVDTNSATTFLEDAKALYNRDEFAKHVQDWNALRSECVELAITKMVLPDLRKELHAILLNEAREFVLKEGCKKLFDWLKVAPYSVSFPDEDEYDWDTSKGVRVMALAYVPDYSQAAFCAIVSPDGEITDHLRLPNILKRKGSFWEDERELKNADLSTVTHFIRVKKPHVIVIGGESREATMVRQDLQECIQKLHDDEQFPLIAVEIIDNELSKIYANSQKGTADFRDYPNLLRQAVSLARRTQDPLIEFSQLCTADEEITCLRFHTLQEHLQKEEFLENLYIEFINRTNEVGVDVNLAVQNPLTVNLVQFICGLGPRKGQALIKILKQTNQRLENRTQLVTVCHMGPKVFINCSGFIKIDTNSLGDSTEAYVEVLDGSRVHPETYEWARKMAVDALEYDDEDANPAGALEEILETPERLKDLDLDAFAEELERQGFGNKSITLYDIRSELNSRYKDLRVPWRPLNSEELFDVLTKETPDSFYIGKLVLGTVIAIAHKKPQGDILDQANPVRNEESGLWQCPFCLKNDFPELGEVWSHFDTGDCVGQATGVKLKLDNGLLGYIPIKNLSDSHVKNPEERVHTGQAIHVRVTKIEVDRFSCDCTSKSSDLADRSNEWRPRKDEYYDNAAEERDMKAEEAAKKHKERTQYVKRVIVHPAFMNKSYTETLRIMASKEQGDVIIRPSSKGSDHLTVTWKVVDDIYQHIDVREEGKENAFTLGKSLWIGNEDFEDLDEIIARHINPMASFARDLLSYKYYRDTQGGSREKAEAMLKEEKQKNPSKIHYIVSACKAYPGKFLLSYLPRLKPKHEFITVTPDGLRYRGQLFDSINSLLKWFKEHYRDPIPNATPQMATPRGSISSRSPYTIGTSSINNETIKKVAQNMPAHMLNSLSAVTNTPHYTPGTTYGGASSYVNTPYTPSGQTPFLSGMTPYHTPHHSSQTPRYGQQTPSQMGKSPFLHPSAAMPPGAGARGGMMPPPGGFAPSPRSSPHMRSGGFHPPGQENASWARATEAWGSGSRSHSSRTPQAYGSGHQRDPYAQPPPAVGYSNSRGTPRSDYNRGARPPGGREHGHGGGSRTPRGNSTPRSDYGGRSQHQMGAKSPGSVRTASTPKTNTSPKSMNLGDQTPLWDED